MIDETFAIRVREHREARKWRQADLGKRIADRAREQGIALAPVSRHTVRRWERGHPPSDLYTVLIAQELGVPPTGLGTHVGRHLTPDRVDEILRRAGGAASSASHRNEPPRDARLLALWQPGVDLDWERLGTLLAATQRIDPAVIRDMWFLTDFLLGQMPHRLGRSLLPLLCSHLVILRTKLVTVERTDMRRELGMMTGQVAIAAGLLWHALHDMGEANEAYNFALWLGEEMGDHNLQATALVSKALLATKALHEENLPAEPTWALTLMDKADRLAGQRAHPEMQAWMYSSRAFERAAQGDELGSLRDMERAWHAVDQNSRTEPFYLMLDTRSQLMLYQGKCDALLGSPARGARLIEQALGEPTHDSAGVRLWLMMDLAGVLIQAGEIDRAAQLLLDVWSQATGHGIIKFIRRIQRFTHGDLAAHRNQVDVRSLRERVAAERYRGWGLVPPR